MAILLKCLSILAAVFGLVYALAPLDVRDAFQAGDYGGASGQVFARWLLWLVAAAVLWQQGARRARPSMKEQAATE